MERFYNNKNSKQSYYEIFSSCRLCGSGGGYKMPILQKLAADDFVDMEVELQVKIRDCVSIEVKQQDKMPPLICELCVDKIDDFYEFREMCKTTNTRIRLLLGLPPQSLSQEASEDCILGISGPVFKSSKEPESPSGKSKVKGKSLADVAKKDSNKKETDSGKRLTRGKEKEEMSRQPSPPTGRTTRHGKGSPHTPVPVAQERHGLKREREGLQEKQPTDRSGKKARFPPTTVLRQAAKRRSTSSESPLTKRSPTVTTTPTRSLKDVVDKSAPKALPAKGPALKVTPAKASKVPPTRPSRLLPAKPAEKKKPPLPPVEEKHPCAVCSSVLSSAKAHSSHLKTVHSPTYTLDRLTCNACREWFTTAEELATHHKWHRTSDTFYHCHACDADFKYLTGYQKHIDAQQCVPETEVPDLECPECLGKFPTKNWMDKHKCPGVDGRPGGKCENCNRKYAKYKMLMKHRETCLAKSKTGVAKVSPVLLGKLLPMQVRMQKCDSLLQRIKMEPQDEIDVEAHDACHYDVSAVKKEYGLDMSAVYPYISSVRSLWQDEDDYESVYSDEENQDPGSNLYPDRSTTEVESLKTITLRAIFNSKMLQRRRRRPKRTATKRVAFAEPNLKTLPGDETLLNKMPSEDDLDSSQENSEVTERDSDTAKDDTGIIDDAATGNEHSELTDESTAKEDDISDNKNDNVDVDSSAIENEFDDSSLIDEDISAMILGMNDDDDSAMVTDSVNESVQVGDKNVESNASAGKNEIIDGEENLGSVTSAKKGADTTETDGESANVNASDNINETASTEEKSADNIENVKKAQSEDAASQESGFDEDLPSAEAEGATGDKEDTAADEESKFEANLLSDTASISDDKDAEIDEENLLKDSDDDVKDANNVINKKDTDNINVNVDANVEKSVDKSKAEVDDESVTDEISKQVRIVDDQQKDVEINKRVEEGITDVANGSEILNEVKPSEDIDKPVEVSEERTASDKPEELINGARGDQMADVRKSVKDTCDDLDNISDGEMFDM